MSSIHRLMRSAVDASSTLQLVMVMNALRLASGDKNEFTTASIHGAGWKWWLAYALQILTLVACMIAGVVFLARSRDTVAHDGGLLDRKVPAEDEADNDEADNNAGETLSDRWYRYKNCSMSECSDPEYWMELNHIELSTSESELDVGPNPVRDRLLEVVEGSNISNRAIASWLFSRVKRRLENVTDEADTDILTDMYYALSVGLINMTNGNLPPSFEQIREIVLRQSNIAYDADSPSASLSMAEMREEIVQSELHVTEHYNDDGSLDYVSYTLVNELMANSVPVDGPDPVAMDVDMRDPCLVLRHMKIPCWMISMIDVHELWRISMRGCKWLTIMALKNWFGNSRLRLIGG